MSKWFVQPDESWKREDGVTVRPTFSHNKRPWAAARSRPKGAPHHREDRDYQWLRKQGYFGTWGVVQCFQTAAACMKAADKQWPVSSKTKRAA